MTKSCPNEEMLADYIEGRLSEQERTGMEAHLSDCQRCLEGFMVAEKLFRDGEDPALGVVPSRVTQNAIGLVESQIALPSVSLEKRLKRSIRNLYSRLLDFFWPVPFGRLALKPIRGSKTIISDDLVHLTKSFPEIETEIEIEKTGKAKALIRVKLTERSRQKKGIRVSLNKGEREISSHPMGGVYVLFEETPFGHYGLSFYKDGVKLGTYLFEIKESPHDRK